jgi:hypothetical protein
MGYFWGVNPVKSYTTHPFIKRDEFKPIETTEHKDNKDWKFRILRRVYTDTFQDFVLCKVEDGPRESFALWAFSIQVPRSPAETEKLQLAYNEEKLDQATVHNISRRPNGVQFEGCDFVIFEDRP